MSLATAITRAKALQQDKLEIAMPAFGHPAMFRIGATEYAASLYRSGVRSYPDDNGHMQKVEYLRIDVRKTVLATQPDAATVITCGGVDWFLNPNEPQIDAGAMWIIRAKRIC